MKCIITGATGYIGSHVLKYLVTKKWDVAVIVRPSSCLEKIISVSDRIEIFEYSDKISTLVSFFQEQKADVVFHIAASVNTNYRSEHISTLIDSNIKFGVEILEAMKMSETRLIVSTGSYWQNYNEELYNPVDLYAATKEAYEKMVKFYVEAFGIRHINLRLYDVYGEDDRRPKLWTFLQDVIATDKHLDVSPGEQYLDMVHIDDVCSAYERAYNLLILDKEIKNSTYAVCTGNRRKLKDLIELFYSVYGKEMNVCFGGRDYKEREVMSPIKMPILPGWKASISVNEGFKRFVTNK